MPASIGVNLRVTGHCRQGGRKYMEDFFSVAYQQTEDERDLEYAFFGIYDGHGGPEAAAFAKEHLMETIVGHNSFWSDDDEDVLRAIKDGYIATHYAMWKEQAKWPKLVSGLPSTAGTTASVAFIRRGKIYIGHVGDSGIILGYQEPGCPEWKAKPLTKDHKPENYQEMKRIEECGGKVVTKAGVSRVVWKKPRGCHQGPIRRSTHIDEIPFLAIARSLGDLWSYNSQLDEFVISPVPDCSVIPIDTDTFRCLIFGTDGLYNMLSPQTAVHIVQQAEKQNECAALGDSMNNVWLNPSRCLVDKALERWSTTRNKADNTSVITLMLDPPGPPRAQVLKSRRRQVYPESGLQILTRYENASGEVGETPKAGTSGDGERSAEESTMDTGNNIVESIVEESKDIEASDRPEVVSEAPEVPTDSCSNCSKHRESIQINEISSSSNDFFDETPEQRMTLRNRNPTEQTVKKRKNPEADNPEAVSKRTRWSLETEAANDVDVNKVLSPRKKSILRRVLGPTRVQKVKVKVRRARNVWLKKSSTVKRKQRALGAKKPLTGETNQKAPATHTDQKCQKTLRSANASLETTEDKRNSRSKSKAEVAVDVKSEPKVKSPRSVVKQAKGKVASVGSGVKGTSVGAKRGTKENCSVEKRVTRKKADVEKKEALERTPLSQQNGDRLAGEGGQQQRALRANLRQSTSSTVPTTPVTTKKKQQQPPIVQHVTLRSDMRKSSRNLRKRIMKK